MSKELNEARLTAYVLGELDEQERAAIADLLENSPEARQQVQEIRRTVGILSQELDKEPLVALAPRQREIVEEQALRRLAVPRTKAFYAAAAALAASLLVAIWLSLPGDGVLPPSDIQATITPEAPDAAPAVINRPEEMQSPAPGEPTGQVAEQKPDESQSEPADQRAAQAQTIFGIVSDTTGTVIPGAEVTLSEQPTGEARTAVTDESGRFNIENLEPGNYELKAELPGFQTFSQTVQVAEGTQVRINPSLELGQITEAVIVNAAVPVSQTSRADVATGSGSGGYQFAKTAAALSSTSSSLPGHPEPPIDLPPGYPMPSPDFNTEAYDRIQENPFVPSSQDPLSTFSIDVDTASYANVRRFLNEKQLPPKDAVRIEEMINYFSYEYAPPRNSDPFAIHLETASAPWNEKHTLVRIGLKGREISLADRQPANLVFLIDVSGSMRPSNKLPLLKKAMRLLVEALDERDRVAMVVYAGASGLALPSASCEQKEEILQALEKLEAGGSTNGGAGIRLAYQIASQNFIRGGINRVILATDGDFNVGVTNQGDLTRLIEEKAGSGVFLSVLGFGVGNYKDSTLEKLADQGNGNYAYIDSLSEARKVLVEEIGGTLATIAKDVKIQVEFNPAEISAYRLIGYENRLLRHQDFNDDRKDAGEIGAGHTVTVLYEVVPVGTEIQAPGIDPLKYQSNQSLTPAAKTGEILTLKLRYKQPDGNTSKLLERTVDSSARHFDRASEDFRFAAAVACFGMVLRDSAYKGDSSLDQVLAIAERSQGEDGHGYRAEFIKLVRKAKAVTILERD